MPWFAPDTRSRTIQVISYHPRVFGAIDIPGNDGRQMTRTEGQLLDRLTFDRGLLGLKQMHDISMNAFAEAQKRFPDQPVCAGIPSGRQDEWQGNDGHRDAFRHAYWSARLAQEFGTDWARAFTTAHEGLPGNIADREAMDLYNNAIGIDIAVRNPGVSAEKLAELVGAAVGQGRMVVMDGNGAMAWSDQVRHGQHGLAPDVVIGSHLPTPQPVSTDWRLSLAPADASPPSSELALNDADQRLFDAIRERMPAESSTEQVMVTMIASKQQDFTGPDCIERSGCVDGMFLMSGNHVTGYATLRMPLDQPPPELAQLQASNQALDAQRNPPRHPEQQPRPVLG